MSIFRVKGLAAADTTQLVAFAGLLSMFFFLTLYMQNVLGYSPIQAGAAYLPLTFGVIVSAGVSSQLVPRVGTRPVIVVGALMSSAGVFWLSRIPVDGSYVSDLLPGLLIASLGLGAAFVAILSAANAGVDADKAGLAAALLNASQQVGGALGLAIFTVIATSRTSDLLASHTAAPEALTSGFQRALLASSAFMLAAALHCATHHEHPRRARGGGRSAHRAARVGRWGFPQNRAQRDSTSSDRRFPPASRRSPRGGRAAQGRAAGALLSDARLAGGV